MHGQRWGAEVVLHGRFQLLHTMGDKSSEGTVFKAVRRENGQTVAVKRLQQKIRHV